MDKIAKRPPLKAIFFDVDDTLFSTTEFSQLARTNSVDAMIKAGLKVDREKCLRELNEVIAEFSSNYENHYDKLLLRIPKEAYEGINPFIIVASAVVAYHQTKARQLYAYEDVVEVFKRLCQTNLVLGVITAGLSIKQAEKLVRLNLVQYLSHSRIFISEQIGISKPNPKLYLTACRRTGILPQEAMYVGDHPAHDIDPANHIGMHTVWSFRSGRHLDIKGETEPDFRIQNFWDLLDILEQEFHIKVSENQLFP